MYFVNKIFDVIYIYNIIIIIPHTFSLSHPLLPLPNHPYHPYPPHPPHPTDAATEIITAAYQSELFAKRAVTTRLSIAHTRHDIMCYLTSWSHECYLSGSKAGFNLECMLHVTGFRNT